MLDKEGLSPLVRWFNTRRGTAIFFACILVVGVGIGLYQRQTQFLDSSGKVDLSCAQLQPDGEWQRPTEFFLLTCPYCEKLESHLALIKDGVIRRHVVWNPNDEDMARFVFALGEVGRTDLIHAAEKETLEGNLVFSNNSDDWRAFVTEHNLDGPRLSSIHDGKNADRFIAETRKLQEVCGIRSVPVLMRFGEKHTVGSAGGYVEVVKKVASAYREVR